MNLTKCLKSRQAQAVVEYILMFTILTLGILLVFGTFEPQKLGIGALMNRAVENALVQIRK